jgi:fructoselysine 6-kinase
MSERGAPLLAIGDNCLDVYLSKGCLTVGGNALNVAAHWRQAGLASRYFGAVGPDPEGRAILDGVALAGLDPGDVEVHLGDTAVTLLRDWMGDRTFLLEAFGVGENFLPSASADAAIAAAPWVHLGTNANAALVRRLVEESTPFSVDVSTTHLALPLQGVPLVFASGPGDPDVPIAPLIAALRSAGASRVVVTCGSRGAFFEDGSGPVHAPAAPVTVVDTCGAGDSFIATFIAGYCVDGIAPAEALARAAIAAASTCTYLGGFPQTPRPIPASLLRKYAAVIAAGEA